METDAFLSVRRLTKSFVRNSGFVFNRGRDVVRAVDGIDFEIAEPGRTLGLVGESGSGKTTTGYCILQLLPPTSGEVVFHGRDLTKLRGAGLRLIRREMQIVFQDPYSSLDPHMSVGEIVAEPLEVHGIGTRRSRETAVLGLLDRVGFEPAFARRYPHELSGGQRQRVAIARALALSPELVVCDEPVSALDLSVQAQILNLLKDLQRDLRLTYLFISHDLAVVRTMSDEIAVMWQGRIVERGPADEVYTRPSHEYTQALLAAVPRPDPRHARERKREGARLPGKVDPHALPTQ